MRRKLTDKERDKRLDARWEIIRTANRHRMKVHAYNPYAPNLLGMRNINRAVHVCRQAMLVPGKTLIKAGFKPHVSKVEKPSVLRKLIGERK